MIEKKICMVGAYGVGKTSLVARYVYSKFSDKYQTTVGVKIDKKEIDLDGQQVKLMLWDMAGEDAHTTIKPVHLRGASGYILVIDGLRHATFDVAIDLQRRVSETAGAVPFVCVVNKADLRPQWELKDADLQQLVARGWDWCAASACTGDSVEEFFRRLAVNMLKDRHESPAPAGFGG